MALKDGVLYIADTENHLLRAARLDNKTVQTVAGNGTQAREYFKTGKGIPLKLAMGSCGSGRTPCILPWPACTRYGQWI